MSHETLLRQILAHPDDDQARLVYADLLQAEGDPRGELIAVDLELARDPRPDLATRKRALLSEHGKRWWPGIPVGRIEVKRGFAVRVAGTAPELAAASPIFETEPIERVEIINAGARFEEAPWQATIRDLAVRGSFGAEGMVSLAASAIGDQLEALDLGNASLFKLPDLTSAFPALRRLSLADNSMLRYQVDRLRWDRLAQLEVIDLRRCGFDGNALLAIVSRLSRVHTLRLSGNPIGPDGVFALARKLAELPSLVHLDMLGTGIDKGGVKALTAALPGVRIETAWPSEVVLDLVGRELRFVQHAGSLWKVFLDGEPRHVEIAHSVRNLGDRHATLTHGGSGMTVPLEGLVRAIAAGAVRDLDDTIVVVHQGSTQGETVYGAWRHASNIAKLGFTARAIEVTFEEYIDTSE